MYVTTRDSINIVLKVVGAAGFIGIVIVAPNSAQALKLIMGKKSLALQTNYSRLLTELKRRGLIIVNKNENSFQFNLTPAGLKKLQQVNIEELTIKKQKKWDKHWRIVTFDVPVRYSKQRMYFTKRLKILGFFMLQKSIWVHPYPCFDELELTAEHYNVMRFCTYMEIVKTDEMTARKLLRHFRYVE